MQEQWDKEAQAHYNALYLVSTVRNCELLSDEEVNAKLDKLYGNLEHVKKEIENINTTAENLRKANSAEGSTSQITASATNRLGGGLSQLPPGVEVDPTAGLEFGSAETPAE